MENLEYALELFGFTASQHSLERHHILRKVLNSVLDNLVEKLCAPKDINAFFPHKNAACDSIILSLKEDMKRLDTLDQKYFTVPGHVLLESDFAFSKQYTDEDERALDEDISQLNKLYLENCVCGTLLEEEEEEFMLIKPFLDDEIETHTQLTYYLNHFNSEMVTLIDKTKKTLSKF